MSAEREAYQPFPDHGRRNLLQRVLEVPLFTWTLALPAGGRVLEIGCGRGVALPVFARLLKPELLVGVDVEREFLGVFRTRHGHEPPATAVQGDVHDLPFPDERFDMVIDFGTCYHIEKPHAALSEIARVLAPGGVFATEAKLSQILAHPMRTRGRTLEMTEDLPFRPRRHAVLWSSYTKVRAGDGLAHAARSGSRPRSDLA